MFWDRGKKEEDLLNDIFDDSDSDEDEEWFPSPDSHLESVDSENIMSLTSQSENTPPVVNINQHISFMVNGQYIFLGARYYQQGTI